MEDQERLSRQELLEEMVRHQRRSLLHTRLALLICVVLLIAAGAALYGLYRIYPAAVGVMEHLESSLEGIDRMVSDIDALVEANSETLTEAMEKIRSLDLDQLNEAIGSLSEAAGPLRQISGLFGGGR